MRTRSQLPPAAGVDEIITTEKFESATGSSSSTLSHKGDDAASDEPPAAEEVTGSWSGWAEIENDARIFTTLLREWGVPDVHVHEIIPLESVFNHPADSIYGLIFLSRWTASETPNNITEAPQHVWFANQTSAFSCASVALLNIINNRNGLNLGKALNDFKSDTTEMSPKDRGLALDRFDHVRDVHNSFSTPIDRLVVDLRLKQDAVAAEKKKRAQNSKKRSKKRKIDDEYEDDEPGYHFVAYVPAGGFVWQMDGLEPFPRKIGTLTEDTDWIMLVLPALQATWENASSQSLEFSLLSLTSSVESPDLEEDQIYTARMREDWGPFIAHMIKLHADKGDLKQILSNVTQ